ncbi:MAG: LCP family protein [Clostridia bacterium]|nr:LCP family protein [Clostridia bacterium]
MNCKKCGKRLSGEPDVCPRCGAPQKATVSLGAIQAAHAKKKGKKKLTKKQLAIRIAIIAASSIAAVVLVVFSIAWGFLEGAIQQGSELSGDIGINEYLPTNGVQNIALFGLDTRQDTEEGRSDAIIILSLDKVHNQIKMTSVARDTLVPVDGYPSYDGKTKITHAFGHGGVQLAVKTLNQNFGMNIQDYVYVNFFEFSEIVDYIGGVYLDVDADEMRVMNQTYVPYIQEYGIDCPPVTETGYQLLNGGQALAYSRNRYTGNDVERGNRQKEVIEAAFAQVKDLSLTKYPGLLSKVLGICHTNLTSSEIMSMASWAVTSSPSFANYSLPNEDCKAWGGNDGGHGWVYIYDLENATALLHNFIYEQGIDPEVSQTTTYAAPKSTTTTAATTTTTTAKTLLTKPSTTTTTTTTTATTTTTTAKKTKVTTTTTTTTATTTEPTEDSTTEAVDVTTADTESSTSTSESTEGSTESTTDSTTAEQTSESQSESSVTEADSTSTQPDELESEPSTEEE